jgi:hypothetical protein
MGIAAVMALTVQTGGEGQGGPSRNFRRSLCLPQTDRRTWDKPVEVPSLRPDLAALVGMKGGRRYLVMRFGYGQTLRFSARRPAAAVVA